MFKIGEFAKLNKVSVQTLRYYDEIGLLKPIKVDAQTGYRFYSAQQTKRLHRILALKELDFSLDDIKHIIDDDITSKIVIDMLNRKASEIKQNITKQTEKLLHLETLINKLQRETDKSVLNYDVLIKKCDPIQIVSIKEKVEALDKQPELWKELIDYLLLHKVKLTFPIAIYHSSSANEDTIELEVAFPIEHDIPETERIQTRILEAVEEMACVIYKGDDEAENAYAAIQQWIEKNGYAIVGPVREWHIEGYLSTLDPKQHVTEIQIPISK
ncbi:MerR family transcriptional regulator [Anoxybacteroides tepidamans]|uniref:MerR family transcriptional regulator n=1 Tax=Anoxybacteroides tepidamans TaxID=265948 RepID=UPI0004846CE9|nr:MerR family transcriptional regulator [Anoxybacillus tepidamans]